MLPEAPVMIAALFMVAIKLVSGVASYGLEGCTMPQVIACMSSNFYLLNSSIVLHRCRKPNHHLALAAVGPGTVRDKCYLPPLGNHRFVVADEYHGNGGRIVSTPFSSSGLNAALNPVFAGTMIFEALPRLSAHSAQYITGPRCNATFPILFLICASVTTFLTSIGRLSSIRSPFSRHDPAPRIRLLPYSSPARR